MSHDFEAPPSPDNSLGSILSRLRHEAGLTGQELGRLVDMSQAKISRLENGVGVPNIADVRRIAEELRAGPDLVATLEELTQAAGNQMSDWRRSRRPGTGVQREIEQLEATTRTFRVFQPALIVGLAQTAEYMHAVLGALNFLKEAEAASARVQRQVALSDPEREFRFVMMESVLQNRVCKPQYMPAQLQKLRDLAAQPNVSVRLIPSDAELDVPPMHGFELLDDRVVVVDVFNTVLITRGPSDLELYRGLFDRLERNATDDIDPILDRYLNHYLDLARPQPRQHAGR